MLTQRLILLAAGSAALGALVAVGCSDDDPPDTATVVTQEARHGLSAEQASQTLVKIGDTAITVGEFADQLADQSPYLRARYNSPERRKEFLDNLVRFELLAAEASRRGYDEEPDVVRTRKQVMIQQLMKAEFEEGLQLSDISEEDIRAYYEAHRSEFQKPEQVRASHILMKNRAAAQRVLAAVLANENDVNHFRVAAEQHNEDAESRDRFGDLRFFSRPGEREEGEPEIAAAVADAAFGIEQIGKVHRQLVETDAGFHIVKLTGRRAALHRTLDEARRPIQNRLWRERREQRIQDFIDRLRREAEVVENLEVLSDLRLEAAGEGGTPEAPPGLPGPTPGPSMVIPPMPGVPPSTVVRVPPGTATGGAETGMTGMR